MKKYVVPKTDSGSQDEDIILNYSSASIIHNVPEDAEEKERRNLFSALLTVDRSFSHTSSVISSSDKIVRDQVMDFKRRIIACFALFDSKDILSRTFPPIVATVDNETDIFLEWAFNTYRFGFYFSIRIADSAWYLVTSPAQEEMSVSGNLSNDDREKVAYQTVKYIMENT